METSFLGSLEVRRDVATAREGTLRLIGEGRQQRLAVPDDDDVFLCLD